MRASLQRIASIFAAMVLFESGCEHATGPGEASESDRSKAVQSASRGFGMNITPPGKYILGGKITHAGKPITAGRLLFYYADGPVPVPATIQKDGTYTARSLEPGKARVAVLLDPQGDLPIPKSVGSVKSAPPRVNSKVPAALIGQRSSIQPSFVKQLTNYAIAPSEFETYRALHKKYSSPKSKELPEVEIGPGTTSFDIVLK